MLRIVRPTALLALTLFTALLLAGPAGASDEPAQGKRADAAKVLPKKWAKRHKAKRATADPDRDGLSNWGEYRSHTRPRRADSDRDGKRDDREDFDRDGLANGAEVRTGHDPGDRDSDGDGIRDGKENAGVVKAFDGTTLTIALAVGGSLTAAVEAGCDDLGYGHDDLGDDDYDDDPAEDASEDYGDDEDESSDDDLGSTAFLAEEGDEDDPGDEEWGDDELGDCGADIAPGITVHQARVEDGVFVELDLLDAGE
jgi:hypothetical protein